MKRLNEYSSAWRLIGMFIVVTAMIGSVFVLVQPTELLAVQ